MEKQNNKYNLTILIVDDSSDMLTIFSNVVSRKVDTVFTASNGEEGLEIYKQEKIDMIFTDLDMPIMNGLEMVRNIRKLDSSVPIVLTSAVKNFEALKEAINLKITSFLEKPIGIKEAFERIDEVYKVKSLEDKLSQQKELLEQYKQIVDKGSIVSKADKESNITYVNEEFCKISGYTKEELIGSSYDIIRHPDTENTLYEFILFTISTLKKPWTGKIKNKRKDGSSFWVKATIAPILDQEGNIIEYIFLKTDITEQETIKHYFEEQFEISNKQFNSAFRLTKAYENAINESNTVSRTDTKGIITFINDRFCKLSGYTKDELIGKNHSIIRHPDTSNSVYEEMWSTIKAGKIWKGIIRNKRKDNSAYFIDSTIVPIFGDDNEIVEYMSVRNDVTEIFELHKEIEDTQREVIYKMGEIGETRSKETGNHVKRVAEYSKLLALLYGLNDEEADILFTASPMHDIGKVGIPDSILNKPGKLNEDEFKVMQGHSQIGKKILDGSNRPVLKAASIVAYEHHEKWDGSGYPRGLKGENIHIYGRITAVADVFDALGSDRCYKKAWSLDDILNLFKEQRAKHFDPNLIDLFFENLDRFLEIRDKYKD